MKRRNASETEAASPARSCIVVRDKTKSGPAWLQERMTRSREVQQRVNVPVLVGYSEPSQVHLYVAKRRGVSVGDPRRCAD